MKTILRMTLGFALAVSPLLAAQEPTPDKEKPRPEEPRGQEPANPKQQPQPNEKPNSQKQEPPADKQQKDQQKAEQKQQQQQEKAQQKQAKEEQKKAQDKNTSQQQGQSAQQNSRTAQAPAAAAAQGKGQRIPPQKFQASFGSEHHFHVRHLENGRRFQYGGYWFEMAEVWPVGWSYDDDCYIEEDGDDYYLVDTYHPEMRVMVIVVEA